MPPKVRYNIAHTGTILLMPCSQLVVGFDQIGSYILPSSGTTFTERGSRQVNIVAKDEKRAYTLLVASTPEGTFLLFQQVWAGASPQSLPSTNAQGMAEAHANGFDFTFAKSNKKGSHFSTLKTMKEVGIHCPFMDLCIDDHGVG